MELARRGEGLVEPNPMVGCVIAQGKQVVGEGWHTAFGQPHAEIEALPRGRCGGGGRDPVHDARTLLPRGPNRPLTEAIIAAGIRRKSSAANFDPLFIMVNGLGVPI